MSVKFEEKTYNTDTLDTSLWKRIFSLIWEQKYRLFALFAWVIVLAITEITFPLLHKYAIDHNLASGSDTSNLWIFATIYLSFVFVAAFGIYIFIYL